MDDYKELSQFFAELQLESDRGMALVGAAHVDERLLQILQAFFCDEHAANRLLVEGNAPLGTFSARAEACLALGFIDAFEYAEIKLIRKIRNEFAHATHGTSFKTNRIEGLCSSLKSELPDGVNYPNMARARFINSTVSLASRLFHRPEGARKQKRNAKVWVKPEQIRWRGVDEELPPEGMSVITLCQTRRTD
jgi:hypothetical protein